MIEFTLSKLNLLIFVTAIAAIVIFFMNTVNSNLLTKQSFELTYRVGKQIKAGIDSKSYCSVKYIELPDKINTSGSTANPYNLNYVLNMSDFEIPDGNYQNKLVLSILNAKKDKIYAAYDIDYNGNLVFYNAEYDTGLYNFTSDNNHVNYDPLKSRSIDNRLVFIKKIKNGVAYYYIVPCAKKNGIPQCKNFICDTTSGLITTKDLECLKIVPDLCSSE